MQLIFLGTGKQARNILFCIYKNRKLLSAFKKVRIVAIDQQNSNNLQYFRKYAKVLLPKASIQLCKRERIINIPYVSRSLAFITTPPSAHLESLQILQRLGAKRIVLEKPIAASMHDFHLIKKFIKRYQGLEVYIQEQYFYSRVYQYFLQIIKDPAQFFKNTCHFNFRGRVISTLSLFYKDRIQDSIKGRSPDDICLLELPHILCMLCACFGAMRVKEFNKSMRVLNTGSSRALIALQSKGNVAHIIRLSNTRTCKRVVCIYFNKGVRAVLSFPGQLHTTHTKFRSQLVIYKHKKKIYHKIFEDDHLSQAVKSYLQRQDILGSFEKCSYANKLAITLTEH